MPSMDPDELIALDREHVWHPYAPMPATQRPLVVSSASGVRLRLAGGEEVEFPLAEVEKANLVFRWGAK